MDTYIADLHEADLTEKENEMVDVMEEDWNHKQYWNKSD